MPLVWTEPRFLRTMSFLAAIVAMCAALAAYPASAQEAASAASADAAQAGGGPGDGGAMKGQGPDRAGLTDRDIELVAPQHASASLQLRASLKTSTANAPGKVAGRPAANVRIGPPMRSGIDVSAPRNAIGMALPGGRPPGPAIAGVTTQPGIKMPDGGKAAGTAGGATHPIAVPTNAGPALHGAAINGTTMGRMAVGPGSIGGPARVHSGINGTLMRAKP